MPAPRRSDCGGFTLLEVICALAILMLGCTVLSSALSSASLLVQSRRDNAVEFDIAVELLECIELNAPPQGLSEPIGGAEVSGTLDRAEGRFAYTISRGTAGAVEGMDVITVRVVRADEPERGGAVVERLVAPVGGEEPADAL
jgi:hypothetical protein